MHADSVNQSGNYLSVYLPRYAELLSTSIITGFLENVGDGISFPKALFVLGSADVLDLIRSFSSPSFQLRPVSFDFKPIRSGSLCVGISQRC